MSDFSRLSNGKAVYTVKDAKAREDLSKKADTESPAFTGTPTVPTAVSGTSTGQIASTEYVMNESKKISSPIFEDWENTTESVPDGDTSLSKIKSGETVSNLFSNVKAFCKKAVTEEQIVDNCDSVDSGKVLSANQGKILQDKIKAIPVPVMKSITLLASNWIGDSSPYTYDLSSEVSTNLSIIKFDGSTGTQEQLDASEDACIQSGNGTTIYAFGEKPTVDIPVVCVSFNVEA